MYQRRWAKQTSSRFVFGSVLALLAASPLSAQDAGKCQRTVAKETAKYDATLMKNLQKCEDGKLRGKTGSCPDEAAAAANAAAREALDAKILAACEGLTYIDMGYSDLQADCANACSVTLVDAASVSSCLACIGESAVEQLLKVYYGAVEAPSADKGVLKCQQTLGKSAAKHFATVRKTLQKCEDAALKGGGGPCPDGKSSSKISSSAAKVGDAVAKSCPEATLAAAFNLSTLGSRVGGVDASCLPGSTSPSAVASGVSCVTEENGDCATDSSVGRELSCNPVGLCGDGVVQVGETCDDGNTVNDDGIGPADFCPSDCSVGPCTASGTRSVTVNFNAPSSVVGMTIVLTYDDTKVRIPGQFADAAVQARLSSTAFSFTPNDLNYALRNVLLDSSFAGVSSGAAFQVQFDACEGGGAPTAGDFSCVVAEATNANLQPVSATCSVTVN
jgi:cysteine-rich repeat protein